MTRTSFRTAVLFVCGSLVSTHVLSAPAKKTAAKADPALPAVERVLQAEVAGEVDRRGQLAATLEQHPGSMAARWQSGFVREHDKWISFEDAQSANLLNESLTTYLERRARSLQAANSQLDLANWCRANKLPDQEQSHLFAALALDPGDRTEQIVVRLGYARVCGQWLNSEQLADWHELNRQSRQSLKRWESQLTKLTDRLTGTASQKESAIASLKKIADNSAIAAIEYVLGGIDIERALVAIELLQQIDGYAATQALARQSIFSPWPEVRKSSGTALKGRPLDHFVPDLLGLLSGTITTQVQMWQDPLMASDRPFGTLYYNYVVSRETDNQFQVATFLTIDHTLESKVTLAVGIRTGATQAYLDRDVYSPRFQLDWGRSIADRLKAGDDAVARENEHIAEYNARIGSVLGGVSGQDPQSTPQDWWQWWTAHSDLDPSATKSIVTVSEQESVGVPSLPRVVYTPSCFAAGTPVWTASGTQPIESIQIGDRVLAKNTRTGELTFKPVLKTTVRPPKELATLRIGDETIVCTGGHRFWVSGSGWVKARDLEPQTLLHTVTGNAPVWTTKKGQTAETYNLVVADFHTYFVGKTGILCQDLAIPRATNNVVPGLDRSNAAAPARK